MAFKIINNDVIRPQKDGGEEWCRVVKSRLPLFTHLNNCILAIYNTFVKSEECF